MKLILIAALCVGFLNQVSAQSCTACLNGGIAAVAPATGCVCPTGFQGNQCQYAVDPCSAVDASSCANVNCYASTSDIFFGCQAKCLCCRNKVCFNGGRVVGSSTGTCTCECFSVAGVTKYDPATDCKMMKAGQCTDDARCATQFGVFGVTTGNCKYDFIKYICPKTCGVCV